MKRRLGGVWLATVGAALITAAPAMAAKQPLNAYRVAPTAENKQKLAQAGFDLTEGDRGRYLEIYATRGQARELADDGVAARQITANRAAAAAPEDYIG